MAINRNTAVSYWGLPLLIALLLGACGGGGGSSGPPPPSALSYPVAPAFTVGTAITALTPTVTGSVTTYTVSPALPAGLALNGTTGVISGTPTAITATAAYTITASNSSGSAMTTVSLVVNEAPPSALSYPAAPAFTLRTAIMPLTPTVTGSVTAYSVSPGLPFGLSLNSTTGVISGTPISITPRATYTITASNSSGSATTTVSLVVNDLAPIVSYALAYSYTAGIAARAVTPTVSAQGGQVVSWSVSPSLPAGLAFSTTDGTISGTPSQAAPAATYTVTATNTGGTINLPLSIAIAAAPLLDLGHSTGINFMRLSGTRVLSLDYDRHWLLQDFASGAFVLTGDLPPPPPLVGPTTPPPPIICYADVAGPTVVARTAAGFNTYSSTTGAVLASVATTVSWCALASDGSYVATGNTSGLTVWSPTTGQMIFTRAGDYSTAVVYAMPSALEVALGPAGAYVIETLSVPGGGSTVTSPFQGYFIRWFIDGTSFLTTLGTTDWIYSNAAVQENIFTIAASDYTQYYVGGEGPWFWAPGNASYPGNFPLNVYAVGTGNLPPPAYSSPPGVGFVTGSGTTLGILSGTAVTVVDLSGAVPVGTTYTTPIPGGVFTAASASSWLIGAGGVVVDGSQLPAKSRFLTIGAALSIAGGTNQFAIATASGSILYFDSATNAQLGTISFSSESLSISTDGSVLAAAAYSLFNAGYSTSTDRSIRIYSLPSGALIDTIPYTANVTPFPTTMTMSGSGTVLAEMLADPTACYGQVIPTTGGAPIWCDTTGKFIQLVLSPDGTLLAASTGSTPDSSSDTPPGPTNIYKNGTLVTTVAGWAAGWIDNGHLLVNNYTPSSPVYIDATIYDSAGTKLSEVMPPEMLSLQPMTATSVFDSCEIVSTANGAVLWSSGDKSQAVTIYTCNGAIAGSEVVFVSGSLVLTQPY